MPIDAIGKGKEVAAQKSSPDERDRAEVSDLRSVRDHELALLRARRGPIGQIIGSDDPALTISFFVLAFSFALLAVSAVASIWNSSILTTLANDLFKVILAIVGYIFGKLHGRTGRDR